jgi:hypothetical protein
MRYGRNLGVVTSAGGLSISYCRSSLKSSALSMTISSISWQSTSLLFRYVDEEFVDSTTPFISCQDSCSQYHSVLSLAFMNSYSGTGKCLTYQVTPRVTTEFKREPKKMDGGSSAVHSRANGVDGMHTHADAVLLTLRGTAP